MIEDTKMEDTKMGHATFLYFFIPTYLVPSHLFIHIHFVESTKDVHIRFSIPVIYIKQTISINEIFTF